MVTPETLNMDINTDTIKSLLYAFSNGVLVGTSKYSLTHNNNTDYDLFYSTDMGQTWTEVAVNFHSMIYTGPDYILFSSLVGLYRMNSNGDVQQVGNQPTAPMREGVKFSNSKIVFSCYYPSNSSNEGLYQYDYDEVNNALYNKRKLDSANSK